MAAPAGVPPFLGIFPAFRRSTAVEPGSAPLPVARPSCVPLAEGLPLLLPLRLLRALPSLLTLGRVAPSEPWLTSVCGPSEGEFWPPTAGGPIPVLSAIPLPTGGGPSVLGPCPGLSMLVAEILDSSDGWFPRTRRFISLRLVLRGRGCTLL